jgi:hypothetical protein
MRQDCAFSAIFDGSGPQIDRHPHAIFTGSG